MATQQQIQNQPGGNPQATIAANQAYFNQNPNIFGGSSSVPSQPQSPGNAQNSPTTGDNSGNGGTQPPNPTNPPSASTGNPLAGTNTNDGGPQGTPGNLAPGQTSNLPANGFNSANISASNPPNLYDLYQQELANRGVSTANKQLLDISQQILQGQQTLAPLNMSNFQFPQALKPLQEGGATQAQLNLQAAQAAAPIQTAMSFLIQSRSALSDYISNQSALAQQAVTNVQTQYENALKSQSYTFTQIGQHIDAQGNIVPDYGYVNQFTGRIQPAQQPNQSNLSNNQYNTGGFAGNINGLIGSRPVKGQVQQEFYNTQTGQRFSTPKDLADFYNQQTGTQSANASNIFSLLASNNPPPQTGSGAGQGIDSVNSRTYRNANPIAASVAVNGDGSPNMNDPTTAEWIKALNGTNIPYSIEQGHNFGTNRATISFPTAQNGLDGAITLLGTSAFNWYKSHTGQDALQGISTPQQFTTLPYDQKVNIVKQIYSHEQAGGSLFSSNQTPQGENSSIKQQINSLPLPFQKSVVTSPSGYTFINTANMSDKAAQNVYYSIADKPGIVYLNPQNSQKETSLITGYKLIDQAQQLVDSLNLPTNAYDPERLTNIWNQSIGASPKLAQLNQMWQGAVQTLQGLGVSGLRSTMLIEKAASSDFPTAGSVKDVAQAQLAGLRSLLMNEESATMGKPLQPDYAGWAQKALQSSIPSTPSLANDIYNQLFGGNSGTTTASLLGVK